MAVRVDIAEEGHHIKLKHTYLILKYLRSELSQFTQSQPQPQKVASPQRMTNYSSRIISGGDQSPQDNKTQVKKKAKADELNVNSVM